MKRNIIVAGLLVLLTAGFLPAQNEADNAYISAMTQSDPCQKVQMLKAFLQKYAGKGSQYENFANAHICLTPCASTPASEKIQYGEKALTMSGIDDQTKTQLHVAVIQLHIQGQSYDKAKAAAGQLIEYAKANKEKNPSDAQWG